MPRVYELTYNAEQGRPPRWRKIYKGHRYHWPAGNGKSDVEAYRAAQTSWKALKKKLDQEEDRKHEPKYLKCIAEWEQVLAIALQRGDGQWAARAEDKLSSLRSRLAQPKLAPVTYEDWLDYECVSQPMMGWDDLVRWKDRLHAHKAAPTGDSVQEQIKLFLTNRQERVAAGALSATRYTGLKINLADFEEWIGPSTSVREINGSALLNYRGFVQGKITTGLWKPKTGSHKLEAVKCWVRWLWTKEMIGLPRVLQSKEEWPIKVPTSRVKDFSVAEVKRLLAAASPRTRCYILLALNCGMTQTDLAALRRDEVDLKTGTITRKRTKTKGHEGVPEVVYKLWKTTRKLLAEEMEEEGELAFVTETGRRLLTVGLDGKKSDAVKNSIFRVLKKTGITGSFKMLRKTSAGLLENSAWNKLVDLFLGHAAAKISDKHYARAAMGRLAQALAWLAKRYGTS